MATLENKTVVIFGGSAGIGYGVAEACLSSRASLVIIVSSNADRVTDAVRRLEAANLGVGKVQGGVVDATDQAALKQFVTGMGEVDHIAWTSGDVPNFLGFPNVDVEHLKKGVFDVRFWGPVIVAQNAKIREGGSLTLTNGGAVIKPQKTWSIAAGIAGAADSLTRGLAVDLAPIRVNIISPGVVKTEFWNGVVTADKEKFYEGVGQRLLVGHVALPAEVAEAYLFVMKCTFITGQRIAVDGGLALS